MDKISIIILLNKSSISFIAQKAALKKYNDYKTREVKEEMLEAEAKLFNFNETIRLIKEATPSRCLSFIRYSRKA